MLETISKFSWTILTGIYFSWQAFLGFNLRNSFKIVSFVTKLKEKDIFLFFVFSFILIILGCFSYFLLLLKQDQKYWGFLWFLLNCYLTWDFWVMLLKKVLKVSASSWLFVIVLLLSFSIIVSLRNAFSENRGLIVCQNFLLSEITLLFNCLK